jgi:type II secretory pathway pseudopilin PulG
MHLSKLIVSNQRRAKTAAFSLIEASVGMGILGMVVVALFSGFTTGFFTMQLARENLRATQILLEKMETIRLYSWDQINSPNFIPATFSATYDPNAAPGSQGLTYTGTMTITDAPIASSYAPDMKMVTVTLDWKTGNLKRTRDFTSYISRYGMQDYIY